MKKFISFSVLSLTASFVLIADPVSVNPRPRMQSMGGAGLAGGGTIDSAMLNPASLADINETEWQLFPLMFELPYEIDTLNSYLDFKDVADSDSSTQSQKQAALRDFLGDVASTAAAARVNFYPSYTRKNFHVGLLMDIFVDAKMRAGGATSNQVVELGGTAGTTGLIVGGSYSFLENRLHVGATLKPLYRFSVVKDRQQTLRAVLLGKNQKVGGGGEVGIQDTLVGESFFENKAFGVGVDLGARYDIPFFEELKPSVGLTYQDIGNTRFFTDRAQPDEIPQSISAGVAIQPTIWIFKNTFALDMRNINEEQDLMNMLHFGAESVLWNRLAFRVGLGQGYFSGGIGANLWLIELDAYVSSYEAGRRAHIQDQNVIGFRLSAAI